jgi:hypothetical protein
VRVTLWVDWLLLWFSALHLDDLAFADVLLHCRRWQSVCGVPGPGLHPMWRVCGRVWG